MELCCGSTAVLKDAGRLACSKIETEQLSGGLTLAGDQEYSDPFIKPVEKKRKK